MANAGTDGGSGATERIAFLLLPKFPMIGLFCALEPLRVANRFGGALFDWRFVSLDGEAVAASNSIPVSAEARLADLTDVDLVIVCASYEPERHLTPAAFAPLRRLARQGTWLGALDTGPFVLAEAGLLDGYRATLHWESLPAFRETYPEVETTSELFEIDRDRITCAGGAAAIDMMLELIRRRHGRELAIQVADQLLYYRSADPGHGSRIPARLRFHIAHPALAATVEAMERNIEEPLDNAALAAAGGLSVRQMERLFHDRLADTPRRFYRKVRLERAQQLLNYGRMSIVEVAVACGFPASAHFSRAYREHFGVPPSAHRLGAAAPPTPAPSPLRRR